MAVLGTALFFTYSQSSMVALFVAVLGVLVAVMPTRLRVVVAVAAVALVAVTAVAVAADARDEPTRRITRRPLVRIEDADRVVAERPVVGAGIGAQPAASRRLAEREATLKGFVSHTTPLTVAAELGLLGLALYAALLAGAAWAIDQVRRRDLALGLTLGAALVALRSLAHLQRLLRGSPDVVRAGGRVQLPRQPRPRPDEHSVSSAPGHVSVWPLLATLAALVIVAVPAPIRGSSSPGRSTRAARSDGSCASPTTNGTWACFEPARSWPAFSSPSARLSRCRSIAGAWLPRSPRR